jgi:cytosine/adenosine deaminase-related metal-dependent hydrolase
VVLAAHPGNVDTVLVGGRTVKRGGRLVAADLPGVLALAEVSRRRVLATIAEQRGA